MTSAPFLYRREVCRVDLSGHFYRYGGHIELIRFKEYYGMPGGGGMSRIRYIRSVFTRAFWADFSLSFPRKFFLLFLFTSFSGHRPAQRECARTGLIGPMQGAIPAQSHNP